MRHPAIRINEGKRVHHLRFSGADYDVTSVEHGRAGKLRVLDLDRFEIIDVTSRDIGRERVDGFDCRIVRFRSSVASGKRWVASDELGMFLVKEEGSDEDGPYSLTLTRREVQR